MTTIRTWVTLFSFRSSGSLPSPEERNTSDENAHGNENDMPLHPPTGFKDDRLVVDLFAGPGGWDLGLRNTGFTGRTIGIEKDADACSTARAANHERLEMDVRGARHLFRAGEVWGLIASPPCPTFSTAGKGSGREDLRLILDACMDLARVSGLKAVEVVERLRTAVADERSALVLEPLLWTILVRPDWVAWEQVPGVQPIWDAAAFVLEAAGYQVATSVLSSERYGVPQTRKRAVLVARRKDVAAERSLALPVPTHAAFGKPDPFLPNPRSIADALGWDPEDLVGFPRRDDGREAVEINGTAYRARDLRPASAPSFALTEKVRSWTHFAGAGRTSQRTSGQRPRVTAEEPAHTVTGKGTATFLDEAEARQVDVWEAGVLQSFPADYPWTGSRTSQFLQVGNAVPPKMAEAVLRTVIRSVW